MDSHIGGAEDTKRKAKIIRAGNRREMREMKEMKREGRKKGTYLHTYPVCTRHHEL